MNETIPDQPTTIDQPADLHGAQMSSLLGYDHPCLACDYNLRGLAIGANCPECNSPVAESLQRKLLRHADPEYLCKLRSGARSITIAALMPIAGLFLLIPLMFAGAIISPMLTAVMPLVYIGIMLFLFFFGWIRLTTMDPSTSSGSDFDGDRPACRGMSIALAVVCGLGFFVSILSVINNTPGGGVFIIVGALITAVLFVIHFRLGIRQFKRLAHRIPATGLAKYATAVYWVGMSAVVLTLLQAVLNYLMVNSLSNAPPPTSNQNPYQGVTLIYTVAAGFVAIANFFVSLAAYAMYIGLFSRLWSRLSKTCQLNPAIPSS